MTARQVSQVKGQQKKTTSREAFKTVSFQYGFHFYTALGKYTGITANSLSEFAEKLQTIPAQSITFHLDREDFQKWLRNVFGDKELADRFDQFKKRPEYASDEDVRMGLVVAVQRRISEFN
jgi:type I restriction-modification system DNA methylase subunit